MLPVLFISLGSKEKGGIETHMMSATTQSFSDRVADALLSTPSLKRREGQVKMLQTVAQVLAGERPEKYIAIEAGTGTGKSLAYLIPVMMYCQENGKRAIIATGTKNLQDQLAKKDAPLAAEIVAQATGKRPSFVVMYGKSNYLCVALLKQRLNELRMLLQEYFQKQEVPPSEFRNEMVFLEHVSTWLQGGGSGFFEDLPLCPDISPQEQERWWQGINADNDDADCNSCTESLRCPFRSVREEAATADVVIANHHLLIADFLLRQKTGISIFAARKVSRPPEILVIDEAHDFIEAAKDALGCAFTYYRVSRLRTDILRFLKELTEWTEKQECLREEAGKIKKIKNDAEKFSEENFSAVEAKLDVLFAFANDHLKNRDKRSLKPAHIVDMSETMRELYQELRNFLGKLIEHASICIDILEPLIDAEADENEKLEMKRDFEHFQHRRDRLRERFSEMVEAYQRAVLLQRHYRTVGKEGDVCWIEQGKFLAQPIDVSAFLQKVWASHENVVFTSATLFPFPQSEGFRWFLENYGLCEMEAEMAMGVVPSPFKYEEQMQALVARDPDLVPPDPKDEDAALKAERRARRLAEVIAFIAERARGGVLVLFTAREEMLYVAELVEFMLPCDRVLLVQGLHGGKAELLSRFKESESDGKGVLFGLASFWQGVDLPGDLLTTLIIAKMPFPSPDDPVVEAEVWLAGKDWWTKVYRPRTIMTLRQGAGRLIRTENDKGTLLLTDPRAAGRHHKLVETALPVSPASVSFLSEGGER